MRRLDAYERIFWNAISLSIMLDAGFELELEDGLIVGIGIRDNEQ